MTWSTFSYDMNALFKSQNTFWCIINTFFLETSTCFYSAQNCLLCNIKLMHLKCSSTVIYFMIMWQQKHIHMSWKLKMVVLCNTYVRYFGVILLCNTWACLKLRNYYFIFSCLLTCLSTLTEPSLDLRKQSLRAVLEIRYI